MLIKKHADRENYAVDLKPFTCYSTAYHNMAPGT